MAVKNKIYAIPLQSVNANTFTGAYTVLNAGLPEACSMIRIMNKSNQDIIISYNGVTDHDYVQTNTTLEIDAQLNAQPNNYYASFQKNTPIYVKAPVGVGFVYIAGYYQPILN
jgi:hypothetical protein